MSININSKSSFVIAGSAAAAGLAIYGITWVFGKVKNRTTGKEETEEPAEEKPMKAVEDSEE